MTIKDIELRSGMTRANIRYYESLGLLSPARGENGYRDYSETDLVTLLKIKLLRSLEVSLEDIGALSRGEKALGEVLARQMDTLELKEQELTQARELCRQMQSDAVDYQSLDAEHYLDLMRSRSEAMALAREKDKIHTAAVLRQKSGRGHLCRTHRPSTARLRREHRQSQLWYRFFNSHLRLSAHVLH